MNNQQLFNYIGDIILCLVAGLLFYWFATWHIEFASYNGEYTPAFPDSFYHATRILHSIAHGGLIQFDPRIHAPDGAWIPWPWGYDWLVARITSLAAYISSADTVKIMVHIPPAWGIINIALVIILSRALSVSFAYRIIIVACFIFLPLNQQLHLVGRLDHHYMELTMVLLSVIYANKWLSQPHSRNYAIGLGFVLGAATAIHNSLFILQAPIIASLIIFWFFSKPLPDTTPYFSWSLFASTLLFLLPSETFHAGFFDFYYHSSFHLYVAFCVSITSWLLCRFKRSQRSIAGLSGITLLLLLPFTSILTTGYGFVSGDWDYLNTMREVSSLVSFDPNQRIGIYEAVSNYSAYILLLPVSLGFILYTAYRQPSIDRIYFVVFSLMAALLILKQMRFHYFGSFILYLPIAIMFQRASVSGMQKNIRLMTFIVITLLAYWLPSKMLFKEQEESPVFSATYWASQGLKGKCKEDPGIILAPPGVGHYLTYFTECSILANSFIMAPQDFDYIKKTDDLMQKSAQQLYVTEPDVKYVFLMRNDNIFMELSDEDINLINSPLIKDLLLPSIPPAGYEILSEVKYNVSGQEVVFGRAFRLLR